MERNDRNIYSELISGALPEGEGKRRHKQGKHLISLHSNVILDKNDVPKG